MRCPEKSHVDCPRKTGCMPGHVVGAKARGYTVRRKIAPAAGPKSHAEQRASPKVRPQASNVLVTAFVVGGWMVFFWSQLDKAGRRSSLVGGGVVCW